MRDYKASGGNSDYTINSIILKQVLSAMFPSYLSPRGSHIPRSSSLPQTSQPPITHKFVCNTTTFRTDVTFTIIKFCCYFRTTMKAYNRESCLREKKEIIEIRSQ